MYFFFTFAGAWLIHIVLIVFGKVIIDTVPGMTQQMSWTSVNLIYLAVSSQSTHPFKTQIVLSTAFVPYVPLGYWHSLWKRSS